MAIVSPVRSCVRGPVQSIVRGSTSSSPGHTTANGQSTSSTIDEGDTLTLDAVITRDPAPWGANVVEYQLQLDGVDVGAPQASSEFDLGAAELSDIGQYRIVVIDTVTSREYPLRAVNVGVTESVFDADALNYFSRAEGLGGSFDLANILGAYTSDFSAGVDGWQAGSGASAVAAVSSTLQATVSGVGSIFRNSSAFVVGVAYTAEFEYFIPSANSGTCTQVFCRDGLGSAMGALAVDNSPQEDVWVRVTGGSVTAGNANFQSYFVGLLASDLVYIRNVRIRQTSVATFTEAYVKTAISNFIAGCKTDLIWTKLTEIYLLTGVTFGGLMAKLKHAGTATLTNVGPFVTGDYLAVGSGAGLAGNGNTKWLTTGLTDFSAASKSFSVYQTVGASNAFVQSISTTSGGRIEIGSASPATNWRVIGGDLATDSIVFAGDGTGFIVGNRLAVDDFKAFANGVLAGSDTSTPVPSLGTEWRLFRGGSLVTTARMTLAHIGTGLTDTDALNLSNRVNALMTALGANVY